MVGMALFQPWRLFVDEQVDEAFPVKDPITAMASADPSADEDAPATSPPPAEPVLVRRHIHQSRTRDHRGSTGLRTP